MMLSVPAATETATVSVYDVISAQPAVNPARCPRLSLATMYDPPPFGYALMVCL